MPVVYLSLGSNMGERGANIAAAIKKLGENGIAVLKSSSVIETLPYGRTNQPAFLNCALKCETALSPEELLDATLNIERELGRVRTVRWGPRPIDIDIVFYENELIRTSALTVPHPDAHNRDFVLEPLCEIDSGLTHPVFGVSVRELLTRLRSPKPHPQDR